MTCGKCGIVRVWPLSAINPVESVAGMNRTEALLTA
jgi:hypothetical protein